MVKIDLAGCCILGVSSPIYSSPLPGSWRGGLCSQQRPPRFLIVVSIPHLNYLWNYFRYYSSMKVDIMIGRYSLLLTFRPIG